MNRLGITLLIFFLLPCTIATAQKRFDLVKVDANSVRDATTLWHKVVLREIDLTNAYNTPLQEMKDSVGNIITINQLFSKMVKDHVVVMSNLVGDKLTITDSVLALLAKEIKRDDSTCINKCLIVEEWMFDRALGKMVVQIQWIGPRLPGTVENVKVKGRQKNMPVYWEANDKIPCVSTYHQALFAMKYGDIKKVLAQYRLEVPAGENAGKMSVLDYFESRSFTSKIICVENKYQ